MLVCTVCQNRYFASCPAHPDALMVNHVECPCWRTGQYIWGKGCKFHPVENPYTLSLKPRLESPSISLTDSTAQPAPVSNAYPFIWDLVIADMQARDRFGLEKYKVRLQPFNERDALVDSYQELLDAIVYIRQLIFERDHR